MVGSGGAVVAVDDHSLHRDNDGVLVLRLPLIPVEVSGHEDSH